MNFMAMDNIKCMVVLLIFLQMWIKHNQYDHMYPTKSLGNNWCVPKAMVEYKLLYISRNVNHDHVQFMTFN
jgi:hypothetical protein